jgi:hypothetical protein
MGHFQMGNKGGADRKPIIWSGGWTFDRRASCTAPKGGLTNVRQKVPKSGVVCLTGLTCLRIRRQRRAGAELAGTATVPIE